MNNKFEQASKECARYIFDSDCEQLSYQEFIQDGNDPRDHILYSAALVLDELEDFQIDIEEYLKAEDM
jgi:hypothetical protein